MSSVRTKSIDGTPSKIGDLLRQLTEAEDRIYESTTWEAALAATGIAIRICLRALESPEHNDQSKTFKSRCKNLLDQAEGIKITKQWPLPIDTCPENRELSQPIALRYPTPTRALSTKEKIIQLQGSKLHNCIFPPWEEAPRPEEFDLKDHQLFTDFTVFNFTDEQMKFFDGWRRPPEISTVEGLKARPDHDKNVDPTTIPHQVMDLVQDLTSDCSVVASFCAANARAEAGHTRVASSLIYPYDFSNMRPAYSPNGKHVLKLNFNGCFRKVIIDSRLPASRTARSLHVLDRKSPGLLWPALVEKAYLKVRGGYDLAGSNSGTDIWMLLGWIPEQLFLQSNDGLVKNVIWRRIYNAYHRGDVLITIGTGKLTRREEQYLRLASEHDYAITGIKEENGIMFFRIKNPWSESSSCNGRSDVVEKPESPADESVGIALRPEDLPLSTFWMDTNKIQQDFRNMYLSWNPGLFSFREDIHFQWDLGVQRSARSFHRNPQFVVRSSKGGLLWLLLSKHFQDSLQGPPHGETSTPTEYLPGYLSLYAFNRGGHRVILSDNPWKKSPYMDSPNILLQLELPPNSCFTIVVSEQDLPPLKHNFTLSAFSSTYLTLETAKERQPYSIVQQSAWIFSKAGGNVSSETYHTNPQFSLNLLQSSDVALFLEAEKGDIAVNVKLISADGERAYIVKTRDIVTDSGDYRTESALAEVHDLQAGTYTVICSTFKPDQFSKFSLHVCSTSKFVFTPIPPEGCGRFILSVPEASFSDGLDRLLAPLHVRCITRLRLRARHIGGLTTRRSPLRMSIEYSQGPDKRVLLVTGDGEFLDNLSGLRTDDIVIQPSMCMGHGVWLVIERLGGSSVHYSEKVQIDLLSEVEEVNVGVWGKELDEPVDCRFQQLKLS